MKRILCFGDSNTWGWVPGSDGDRFPEDVRWPGVAQEQLGPDFKIIEEAQNGRTTMWDDPSESIDKNGLRHLPIVLESQKPVDLVVLMLGTNDLKLHLNQNALSIAHGMGVLVDRVLESAAGPTGSAPKVLIVSPARVSEGECPFGNLFVDGPTKSAGLAAAYQEIAKEKNVEFLDAAEFASCPVPDTIHIDAESCRRLGKAIATKVSEIASK